MTGSNAPTLVIGRPSTEIILASASPTRRLLLERAGVPHSVEPSRIDEDELKASLRSEGASAIGISEVLAEAKAMYVSRKAPGALVLGADQVLAVGQKTLDKPVDRADALKQLKSLRGRRHELISYAVIVCDGVRIWHAVDRAKLTVRPNATDGFLDSYLDTAREDVFNGPGGYRVESLGVQLFSKIEGAHYTILGLPLLALLDYLRMNGILET